MGALTLPAAAAAARAVGAVLRQKRKKVLHVDHVVRSDVGVRVRASVGCSIRRSATSTVPLSLMSAQPASCSRRVETFCGHTTRLSHVSVSSQCAGRAPPLPVPTLRTVHPFPGPTFAPDQLVVRDAWAGNCSVMHGCGVAYGDSGDCRRHHHRSAECAHHLRPVGRRLQASVCAPETRYGLTPRGRPDAPEAVSYALSNIY